MSKSQDKPKKIPFSIKTFLASSIGHILLFSSFIGMAFLYDPTMLVYDFLFTASIIAGLMMGLYQANYARGEE